MKNNRRQFLIILLIVLLLFLTFLLSVALLSDSFLGILSVAAPAIAILGSFYYIILGIYRVRKGQNTKKSILLIVVGIAFLLSFVFCVLAAFAVFRVLCTSYL